MNLSQRCRVAVLAATALCTPAIAASPEEPGEADHRVILSTFTVGRYYPIGADLQAKLAFKQRIGDSDGLLWRTRFWRVEGQATYNPANWSVGLAAEYEPIAVFQLRVAVEHRGYVGAFGTLISFDDPDVDHSDLALEAAAGRGEHYATSGQTFWLQPTLQAQVGPIGLRNTFTASYGRMGVRAGDTLFYDPNQDLLLPADGFSIGNTATAVYLGGAWVGGLTYSWLAPLGLGAHNQVHRVGALAAYTFVDSPDVFFNKPTLLALALFNVQHRGREAHLPTIVIGFSTESDLLGGRP